MKKLDFVIKEIVGEGVVLFIKDENDADEFDDYLTEKRYVLYHMDIMSNPVKFSFGEGSSTEKIKSIISDFSEHD
jgi:hypothetical protein